MSVTRSGVANRQRAEAISAHEVVVGMGARKSLSKKLRFEVLKRDKFTCQYCGAKAPDVLLNVDHVKPVCDGGGNDILNLIAACENCNNGKGAHPLSDDSALAKKHARMSQLQERREQLAMMSEWQNDLASLESDAIMHVCRYYQRLVPGWSLSESAIAKCRGYVAKHGLEHVMSVIRTMAAKCVRIQDGKATEESTITATSAMLSALKHKEEHDRDPARARLLYIRGIIRNRCSYCPEQHTLDLLKKAYAAGVSIDDLSDAAKAARAFTSCEYKVEQLIDEATDSR